MDGSELHALAEQRAEELVGAHLTQPFGPGADVYKVAGKVFLLITDVHGVPIVNVKITPEDGIALREAHASIRPGWHMNKRHWISIYPGDDIDEALVTDLVTESYLLVIENLPRAKRPIDPAEFDRNYNERHNGAPPTRQPT